MRTLGLILGALLAGCTHPAVTPESPSSQHRIDRAVQWERLGQRTVDEVIRQVSRAPDADFTGHTIEGRRGTSPLTARAWYVRGDLSPFSESFTPMLQDALRERGYTVSLTPHNAVVLNYSVRTFVYGDEGKKPIDYASVGAIAAAMGYAATNATSTAIAMGATGAVGLDVLHAMSRTTRGEAVLSTSVVTSNRIIHQARETFYVHTANLPFYWSKSSSPMTTKALGPVYERTRRIPVEAMR